MILGVGRELSMHRPFGIPIRTVANRNHFLGSKAGLCDSGHIGIGKGASHQQHPKGFLHQFDGMPPPPKASLACDRARFRATGTEFCHKSLVRSFASLTITDLGRRTSSATKCNKSLVRIFSSLTIAARQAGIPHRVRKCHKSLIDSFSSLTKRFQLALPRSSSLR